MVLGGASDTGKWSVGDNLLVDLWARDFNALDVVVVLGDLLGEAVGLKQVALPGFDFLSDDHALADEPIVGNLNSYGVVEGVLDVHRIKDSWSGNAVGFLNGDRQHHQCDKTNTKRFEHFRYLLFMIIFCKIIDELIDVNSNNK